MKTNNCDLELRLRPSFDDSDLSVSSTDGSSAHQDAAMEVSRKRPEQQQMATFYNGKVSACEVTEPQARAIITLANRHHGFCQRTRTATLESSKLLCNQSPTGFSMKRSLQRFLQKRHQRIQDSSPYSHDKVMSFH